MGSQDATDATYDFVAEHRYAESWQERGSIRIGHWDERPRMTAGWSYPGGGNEGLWADGPEAEATFFLREVAARRVRFGLRQYWNDEEGAENQVSELTLRLNGEAIHTQELGAKHRKLDVELPAELQREGINTLTLAFSKNFQIQIEGGTRRLSAWVENLELEVEDSGVESRAERAAKLVESGTRVEAGEAIEQATRSLLVYHLRVPRGARLRSGIFHPGGEGAGRLRFEVRVTPEGGEPRSLARGQVDPDQEATLEGDLAGLDGQVARFEFTVESAEGSGAAAMGVWIGPALTGGAVEEARPEPAQVADLREALEGKPVVLFLLDAFNPDFMTAYGGREGLTPNLDRLAAEGALFESAIAQASYTISSIASTLTSKYAWQHTAYKETTALSEETVTWPEQFAAAGYHTIGLVSSPNGSSRLGYQQGFETYREVFKEFRKQNKDRKTARVDDLLPILEEVLQQEDERPPLLWLHIVEPHEPYHPPNPWSGSLESGYDGTVTGDWKHLWDIREFRLRPSPEELEHIKIEYEENLAYIDDGVRRILERLDREPAYDDALVVIFSDHGEGFLSHERGKVFAAMGHGSTVYEEMARIPLIVRLPKGLAPEGIRSSELVANFDIFPTVADLVGVPQIEGAPGKSFAGTLVDPDYASRKAALSHTHTMHGQRFLPGLGLWEDDWKYIYTSGDVRELYYLPDDPDELTNLAAERPIRAGYMRQRLKEESDFPIDGFMLQQTAAEDMTPEMRAQLEAMGYVGDDA